MNFKKATDGLLASVTLEDLAVALGVSIQAVRQARAADGSSAHRRPPDGWQKAAAKLARAQITHYKRLLEYLESAAAG